MSCDVDIDFADRKEAVAAVSGISAMVIREDKRTAHPSGVYLQNVPIDPFTGLCSLDYHSAEDNGYFKIDFLNQSVYQSVSDEMHLVELLNREPEWSLLEEQVFVDRLPHIQGHFDIVDTIKPKSIEDLAVVLALIRPGKRHLLYKSRTDIDAEIWNMENVGYSFKRAHAVSYAGLVVVRMNLLTDEMLGQLDEDEFIKFD